MSESSNRLQRAGGACGGAPGTGGEMMAALGRSATRICGASPAQVRQRMPALERAREALCVQTAQVVVPLL